jgi:hypothetical protein
MIGFLASVVQQAARDSSIKKKKQCRQYLSKSSRHLDSYSSSTGVGSGWRSWGALRSCINGDPDSINYYYYYFLVQYTNPKRISLAFFCALRAGNKIILGKLEVLNSNAPDFGSLVSIQASHVDASVVSSWIIFQAAGD